MPVAAIDNKINLQGIDPYALITYLKSYDWFEFERNGPNPYVCFLKKALPRDGYIEISIPYAWNRKSERFVVKDTIDAVLRIQEITLDELIDRLNAV